MKKIITFILIGILIFNGVGFTYATKTTQTMSDQYDLLIITPPRFISELQPLVQHKNQYGINTILTDTSEIYENFEGWDASEQIKNAIEWSAREWNITYVLLVGGRKPSFLNEPWLLPSRYIHIEDNIYTPENRYLSDLYFADLYYQNGSFCSWDTNNNGVYGEWLANQTAADILDLYPDVYVGRLPCRNEFEVKLMVNKIISYETGLCDDTWFKKMVVIGGDTYTDNDYYEGEETNQGGGEPSEGNHPKERLPIKSPNARKGRPKIKANPPPRLVCRVWGSPVSINFMLNSRFPCLELFHLD